MSKAVGGVIVAFLVAVIAGLIVAAVQTGIFEPAARHPTSSDSQPRSLSPEATPPAVNEEANPVVPDSVLPSPAALDNKTITEARITVVGDKISPTVFRGENPPGYYASVFTAAGEVERTAGCYVHWELYDNEKLLTTGDTKCGLAGGWSTSWWPNRTKLEPGSVRVTGAITTDWGATAQTQSTFTAQ